MIFDILPGAQEPGTGDALVRRSPRADGNIRRVLRSIHRSLVRRWKSARAAKEDDVRNSVLSFR